MTALATPRPFEKGLIPSGLGAFCLSAALGAATRGSPRTRDTRLAEKQNASHQHFYLNATCSKAEALQTEVLFQLFDAIFAISSARMPHLQINVDEGKKGIKQQTIKHDALSQIAQPKEVIAGELES